MGRGKLQFAFLQVCKAAKTAGQGAFGGLAQRLLNPDGGDLAAVVASPYVLEAAQSTAAALSFYGKLAEGDSPDLALRRDLDLSNFGWAFLELWVRPSALGDTGTRGAFQFVSPYRGLATFQERDADIFFGRDAEIAELTQILAQENLVAVVGDSGSGKSSLLQAGLAHRVRMQGLADRRGWRIVSVRPGVEPARSLMLALLNQEKGEAIDVPQPEPWLNALAALLDISHSSEQPLLLILDQFEEIFTLCKDDAQRQAVALSLARVAANPGGSVRVILGMRSDYLGKAATLPELGKLITRPWLLCPPEADDVRAIVARPADVYGYRFQGAIAGDNPDRLRSLLDRILSDPLLAASTSTPLPLLEFALERLWLQAVSRGSQEFTHVDFEGMGGLSGAIAKHAEDAYQALPTTFVASQANPQRIAETIFTSLVHLNGTRKPRLRSELVETSEDPKTCQDVIDHLIGERLLTVRNDPQDPNLALIDITHEILARSWSRFSDWLSKDKEGRETRESFEIDFERWRTRKALPNTDQAYRYLSWKADRKPALTPEQQAFTQRLTNSVRSMRILQFAGVLISVLLIVTASLAFLALRATRESENNRYWSDIRLAYDRWHDADAGSSMALLKTQKAKQASVGWEWYYVYSLCHKEHLLLEGHKDEVRCVAWSPDDRWIASGSGAPENSIRLWDAKTGKFIRQMTGTTAIAGGVNSVGFSSDGKWLASAEGAMQVRVWDPETGKELHQLKGHTQEVWQVAWNPSRTSSEVLASTGEQSTWIWNGQTGQPIPATPEKPELTRLFPGRAIAWSPDGQSLVWPGIGARGSRNFWAWELESKAQSVCGLIPFSRSPQTMAWRPNGKELAWVDRNASSGFEIQLTEVRNPEAELVQFNTKGLKGPLGYVRALAWHSDYLASAGEDQTIRVWDGRTRNEVLTLRGHANLINGVAWGPDGKSIASASADRTVRVWKLVPHQEPNYVTNLPSFSDDKLWNSVESLAWNSAGDELLCEGTYREFDGEGSYSDETRNKIWQARTMSSQSSDTPPMASLFPHPIKPANGMATSSNGQRLALVAPDRSITINDIRTGNVQLTLRGHSGTIRSLTWSPDGDRLASAGDDLTIRIWDTSNGRELLSLKGHTAPVNYLGWSPAPGWRIASASEDGCVAVWDASIGYNSR